MDLLLAMRDLGIADPLPEQIAERSRSALAREIERASRPRRAWWLPLGRRPRRLALVPAALLATAAVAAAATTLFLGINPFKVARQNVRDAPLQLFERNPGVIGATPAALWKQTVVPTSVRKLGTFNLAGVGPIQYWVANTRQHGICGALRMSNGQWVGLQHAGRETGAFPGCYPTRAQVGAGALMIDGFDYIASSVTGRQGQRWYVIYGAVSGRHNPTRVRDTVSKTSAALVSGHYFAIALHPFHNDYGDHVHLEAFTASGRPIASEGKPLPGTPTVKCAGTRHVVHVHIPGTHRSAREIECSHWIHVMAK